MAARIYLVKTKGKADRLVKATSQAQAIVHVANPPYTISVPATLDVVDLAAKGVAIEDATASPVPAEDAGK